jgi:hypothetical protein
MASFNSPPGSPEGRKELFGLAAAVSAAVAARLAASAVAAAVCVAAVPAAAVTTRFASALRPRRSETAARRFRTADRRAGRRGLLLLALHHRRADPHRLLLTLLYRPFELRPLLRRRLLWLLHLRLLKLRTLLLLHLGPLRELLHVTGNGTVPRLHSVETPPVAAILLGLLRDLLRNALLDLPLRRLILR